MIRNWTDTQSHKIKFSSTTRLFDDGDMRGARERIDDLADALVCIEMLACTKTDYVTSGAVLVFRSAGEAVEVRPSGANNIQTTPRGVNMPRDEDRAIGISDLSKDFPELMFTALPDFLKQVQVMAGRY